MSWANYDDVLQQLRRIGLEVDRLDVNTNKPKRCREIGGDREQRGWYWLSDIDLADGKGGKACYITGAFGIYRGAETVKHKVELKKTERSALSKEQVDAIRIQHAEKLKRAKAMRDAEILRAASEAQKAWAMCSVEGESNYLARKQVRAHGVRYSKTGALAIPMCDASGRIWLLQIIRPDSGDSRRRQKEYWPKGASTTGRFHVLGTIYPGCVVLIAEGYATAATLHEQTGLPVAVAFDANNLLHVAMALSKAYSNIHCLIAADDDVLQKCGACGEPTKVSEPTCSHCGQLHGKKNPGVEAARAAAFACGGAVVVPEFPFDRGSNKLTDFNDLAVHPEGGAQLVRAQIEQALAASGWAVAAPARSAPAAAARITEGGGVNARPDAVSIMSVHGAVERFIPIDDGTGNVVFDNWTRKLVQTKQMVSLLPAGARWDDVKRHPTWVERGAHYVDQVGFDPAGDDPNIRLNLWTGWMREPVQGECGRQIDLLRYLCSNEGGDDLFHWVLKWLAYPLQHPGAKMQTAIVVHGPQGTGKSLFFEGIRKIYDDYGIILNQGAIEDHFNADWASRKLFVLADEIVARAEMYHLKNQLKGFITGDWIRVNPKNLTAYKERNHMNLVFLSNEKQPVLLEDDDRRHCVLWTPKKLPEHMYEAVSKEMEAGGIAALHYHLAHLDLTGFHPWTKPPMTNAKADLQTLSRGSVERFVNDWQALELCIGGKSVPLCPALGSDLYGLYDRFCAEQGERSRPAKELVGHLRKLEGWRAGESMPTWRGSALLETVNRKMIVPSEAAMAKGAELCHSGKQESLVRGAFATQKDWLTAGFEAMAKLARPADQGGDL